MQDGSDRTTHSRRTVLKLAASGFVAAAAGTAGAAAGPDEQLVEDVAEQIVSQETGTDEGYLQVVDVSEVAYEALGGDDEEVVFCDAKVLDGTDRRVHTVRIDSDGQAVDRDAVRERARTAWTDQYGVLSEDLHDLVANAPTGTEIPIAIWTDGPDRAAARETVDFEDSPTAPQTQTDLADEFERRIAARTSSLAGAVSDLQGLAVEATHCGAPVVDATATPDAIGGLDTYDDVRGVAFRHVPGPDPVGDPDARESTDDTGSLEYDATGYAVGVFEDGGLPGPVETVDWANEPEGAHPRDDHGSKVAIAAASDDPGRPGMAPGATVYASYRADRATEEDGIDYLLKHAPVVNCSYGIDSSFFQNDQGDTVHNFYADEQRVFDADLRYGNFVFNKRATIVKSAGNDTVVTSPGKALNLLTVGGLETNDDDVRVNDVPFTGGSSVAPQSEHDDVETPACSARAQVRYDDDPDDDEGPTIDEGTSYAAPRVAGLVTLMKKFAKSNGEADDVLTGRCHVRPEVARAVAIASTTNAGDLEAEHNGPGAVVASNAEEIVSEGTFEVGAMEADEAGRVYTMDGITGGDSVTVALSWLSDPLDCEPFDDPRNLRSDVDLDLEVRGPCRQCYPMTASRNSDGGWEHVQFQAPRDGGYEVVVQNADWESSDSHREFCVAWHGTEDDERPQQPRPDFDDYTSEPTSVSFDFSGAGDAGDSGTVGYRVYRDGRRAAYLTSDGECTVDELAPDSTYDIEVSAVDAAGNESPKAGPEELSTDPAGRTVHDFDGSPAWPDENELGYDCYATYFENDGVSVADGALRLEYDGSGYFTTGVEEDVSAYSALKFRLRFEGYGGRASHWRLSVGGFDARFDEAIEEDHVGTRYTVVTVDLDANDVDTENPEWILLDFFDGQDGADVLEIDQIWFAE